MYGAPTLSSISPDSVPTDGCYQWERVTQANRGVDAASGLPIRLCCQPSIVEITGSNFGINPSVEIAGVSLNAQDHMCASIYEQRQGVASPDPPSADAMQTRRQLHAPSVDEWARGEGYAGRWERTRSLQASLVVAPSTFQEVVGYECPSACNDPAARLRNPLLCGSQPSTCCRYENFPSSLDDIDSCPCPVAGGACILSVSHDRITVRPPGGFGANAGVVITIGD